MAVSLPNGAIVAIGTVAAAVAITVMTNASECVVTSAGHGLSNGDFVRITSGWSRVTDRVFRVKSATTDTFVLEGMNTTDTDVFPAGTGATQATFEEVTAWTQVTQILASGSNGGEQQFLEYQFLEADAQRRIPTFKNAAGLTFGIADDPTLAGYVACAAANDDREPRPLRVVLPNASRIMYNGYVSVNKTPSLNVNELMQVEASVSLTNEPVRYAS